MYLLEGLLHETKNRSLKIHLASTYIIIFPQFFFYMGLLTKKKNVIEIPDKEKLIFLKIKHDNFNYNGIFKHTKNVN